MLFPSTPDAWTVVVRWLGAVLCRSFRWSAAVHLLGSDSCGCRSCWVGVIMLGLVSAEPFFIGALIAAAPFLLPPLALHAPTCSVPGFAHLTWRDLSLEGVLKDLSR